MSNRKNYNSLVFLTTLSVYLGLVLVGGSVPSVLAQAATTRDFNIKNEIILEDDLDKKPDDEKIDFAASLENYFDQVESFINELKNLHDGRGFDLSLDKFALDNHSDISCRVNGDPTAREYSTSRNFGNYHLESAIKTAGSVIENWEFLSDCLKTGKNEKSFSNRSDLKIYYDNAELKIELSAPKLNQQKADFLAEKFKQEYSLYKIDETRPLVKKIHENTSFKSENNQIFIVTRLPRGSIDSLLAEKDAR